MCLISCARCKLTVSSFDRGRGTASAVFLLTSFVERKRWLSEESVDAKIRIESLERVE
jgi:hypothetical protein